MGILNREKIYKQGFELGSIEEKVEEYCITTACENTEALLNKYKNLYSSRDGKYINSDLMKMIYPFYAESKENRFKYNKSITNTAAVLTNELYKRTLEAEEVERCIYIVGPYGAGKSYFAQALYENEGNEGLLKNSIVYEGSITPPAFKEKIQLAIKNGVEPYIIVINPTLELSIKNIKNRAKETGRDVEKAEVIDKFFNLYRYMKEIIDELEVTYTIYNKSENIPLQNTIGSSNIEDLKRVNKEEIIKEYEKIIKMIEEEQEI